MFTNLETASESTFKRMAQDIQGLYAKKLLNGLIAATCTPLDKSGELHLEVVPSMVDHLIGGGVRGLYEIGRASCRERV